MTPPNATPPPSIALAGKRIMVTGGSSGIGRAIAIGAAQAGADVMFTYRANHAGASDVAGLIRATGRRAELVQADFGEPDDIARLVETARTTFGSIDGWVNNAGADVLTGPGAALSRREKLELLLRVDLRGTILTSWAAADLMQEGPAGGVIINMSWDGAVRGMEGENPELFAAVKGGVLSFSRSLALSLAPAIRVNVLGPGWIETAFGDVSPTAFKQEIARGIPLGRWGTPEDVAAAAIYLLSDAAQYVTGQMIMVNGGDVM